MVTAHPYYIQERDLEGFVRELGEKFKSDGLNISKCTNPSPCFFGARLGAQSRYTHLILAESLHSTTTLAKGLVNENGIFEFYMDMEMPIQFQRKFDEVADRYL